TRAVADAAAAEAAFKDTPLAGLAAGINTAETAMRNASTALAADGVKDAAHQAKTADQALNEALAALKQFSLDAMSESLQTTEKSLADALARQREIIDRSTALAAIRGEMDLAQARETTAVAATQARLKGETDTLVLAANGLPRVIESWAASEVLAKVDSALKTLKSGKPATKMVNSVIELQAPDPRKALAQQTQAEQTLDQALKAIREAMALVALDRAQLMTQLKQELDQAKADIAAAQPPPPPPEAKQDAAAQADAAQKQDQADKADAADKAKQDAAAKQAAAEKAKQDATAKQDQPAKQDAAAKQDQADKAKQDAAAKQAAAEKAKQDAAAKQDQADKAKQDAAAKQAAAEKAKQDAAAKQDQAAKKDAPQKQDAAAKQDQAAKKDAPQKQDQAAKKDAPTTAEAHRAADRLANLAKLLDKADIQAKELKDLAADPKALAQRLAQDPAAAAEALRIIDRLSRTVEQEVASSADSSRILAGSRGEVPPQYRQLVNRYFESMSRYGQKGGTAP
ncbi:MAG: hypothetical protein J0M02_13635, partial [Planctomycetes bacterium]|nr:hypothetical protein [Planctomycetota bacterium]